MFVKCLASLIRWMMIDWNPDFMINRMEMMSDKTANESNPIELNWMRCMWMSTIQRPLAAAGSRNNNNQQKHKKHIVYYIRHQPIHIKRSYRHMNTKRTRRRLRECTPYEYTHVYRRTHTHHILMLIRIGISISLRTDTHSTHSYTRTHKQTTTTI